MEKHLRSQRAPLNGYMVISARFPTAKCSCKVHAVEIKSRKVTNLISPCNPQWSLKVKHCTRYHIGILKWRIIRCHLISEPHKHEPRHRRRQRPSCRLSTPWAQSAAADNSVASAASGGLRTTSLALDHLRWPWKDPYPPVAPLHWDAWSGRHQPDLLWHGSITVRWEENTWRI